MLSKLSFFKRQKTKTKNSDQMLKELIAPLITPLNDDFSVDFFALKNLTARLLNKGVRNFFVLNNFSEQKNLDLSAQQRIISFTSVEVSKRANLLVGCFGETAEEILEKISFARKYADFCVINIPFVALENQVAFTDFFDLIMTHSNAKIIIYNNSTLSRVQFNPSWLEPFINWESLAGIIDSSRNPEYLDSLEKFSGLVKLFEENEELVFESLRKGFCGANCISSLIAPNYYIELLEGYSDFDYRRLLRNESKISAVSRLIPASKRIQAVKLVLSIQGITKENHFHDIELLNQKERELIIQTFGLQRIQKNVPIKKDASFA